MNLTKLVTVRRRFEEGTTSIVTREEDVDDIR